jgi:hypothetical protein
MDGGELDDIPEQPSSMMIMDSQPVDEKQQLDIIEPISDEEEYKKDIKPDTVIILDKHQESRHRAKLLKLVKPQSKKYWHFTFIRDSDKQNFKRMLESVPGYNLTAEYDERKDKADIILKDNGKIVGKIHLLLSDRVDIGKTKEYYIKVFLFHFNDQQLFNQIKSKIIRFFENLSINSAKRNHATRKHRNSIRRPQSLAKRPQSLVKNRNKTKTKPKSNSKLSMTIRNKKLPSMK